MGVKIRDNSDLKMLKSGNLSDVDVDFDGLKERLRQLKSQPYADRKKVLITGGNGFIGIHILSTLLADPDIETIYALIRAKNREHAIDRIIISMKKFDMDIPKNLHKVEILCGSFTDPKFDQEDDKFNFLINTIDSVISCAGDTNHSKPYIFYREETVKPLLNFLDFCSTDRVKSFHYLGSMGSEVFADESDFKKVGFYHCGYSKMKCVTKTIVNRAHAEGLPSFVYLVPIAVGGVKSRFSDPGRYYGFWQMMLFWRKLGALWDLEHGYLPMITGDLLADTIVHNVKNKPQKSIQYPFFKVTSASIADYYGWDLLSYDEFNKTLKKRYALSLSSIDFKHPIKSIKKILKNRMFALAIFPKYLNRCYSNMNKSIENAGVEPLDYEYDPIDVYSLCAEKNLDIPRSSLGKKTYESNCIQLNQSEGIA